MVLFYVITHKISSMIYQPREGARHRRRSKKTGTGHQLPENVQNKTGMDLLAHAGLHNIKVPV